jgi:hypothetical protein
MLRLRNEKSNCVQYIGREAVWKCYWEGNGETEMDNN